MASWTDRTVTNNHILPYITSSPNSEVDTALNTLPFQRNVFKLMANSTIFFPTFMKLLSCAWSPALKNRSSDWQLIVLSTASLTDAPYEWDVNEPAARIFNFTDAHFAAIKSRDLSSTELFTDRQRLLFDMVKQLTEENKVRLETMEKAKNVLGDEGTMEVLFTHGIYAFLARMMQSCKIDFDEPIEGLEGMLRTFNKDAIEKEQSYKD